MKQGNSNFSDINLDALEREITAAAQNKAASADPLAELARIMGQEDPFAGFDKTTKQARPTLPGNRSLDDILNSPPSMVLRGDQREPNFDAVLDQPAMRTPYAPSVSNDDVELPPIYEPETATIQVSQGQELDGLDSETEVDDLFERQKPSEQDELAGAADIDALEATMQRARATLATDTLVPSADEAVTKTSAGAPQFQDMLAEFESAMRDVGGEKIATISAPSLEPTVVPPPPHDLLYPQNTQSSTGYAGSEHADYGVSNSNLAGAAAAGAAIIAAGSLASGATENQTYAEDAAYPVKKPKRGLMIAAGVIGIAVIGISALFAFGGGSSKKINGAAPVIVAKSGVTKERPTNPGGVDVPNQDKEVLKAPASVSTAAERVAPREEQPLDLKQAQTVAENTPVVRQIPGAGAVIAGTAAGVGSAVVATATTAAPASPSLAGAQPVPRPVASVPIGIAGANGTPTTTTPIPITPPIAVLVPTPAPTAPIVTAVRPVEVETPAAPRRVRSVPIKTDADAASRSQARPTQPASRVAPAAEPDAANAPLRITPQALRGTQRVASTASASAAPVETATPVLPTASTTGGGAGFSVQLGAEGSQESARAKFTKIKSDHGEVLAGQNANIRSADVNGRSVYRIRVGNMPREQAVGMCERLKADGGSCFVARN